jgi:AcrR family transcriptional regulator
MPARPPDPPPDRNPRRDRTRLALVRAGQRLFSERPIEVVSIDDIVQAADVGRGSFYNHFTDKDEFEREILAEARREMEAAIAAASHGEPDPALRTVLGVCVSLRFAHEHPARAGLVARQFIRGGYLQSGLNAGVLRDVSDGILARRFTVPTAEIGMLTVLGVASAAMIHSMEIVILRALGMQPAEAESIAACAAEIGIRVGRGPSPEP